MPEPHIIAGRYEALETLGSGGASAVFKVRNQITGETLALKRLSGLENSPEEIGRFHREFRLLSRLDHPHIVSVRDTGIDGDVPYFTMEYLQGATLAQILENPDDPLCASLQTDFDLLRTVLSQICSALAYIHARGMVHRDLKPANLMVLRTHPVPLVKILDLGTARFRERDEVQTTRSGAILGTLHFMSPEQIRGVHLDGRSDLYSLGVILYEVLTGKRPFDGSTAVTVAFQHINELPVPPRVHNLGVPHDLQLIDLRLLEKEPARRYRSAADLLADLLDPDRLDVMATPEASPPALLLYPRFLGRSKEMAQARQSLADVQRGNGRAIAVSGAPGIGKTRFLEELCADARLQRIRVLSGSCFEDRASPLYPIVEGLRSGARDSDSLFSWLPERDRPVLAGLLPELTEDSADGSSAPFLQGDQHALFAALFRLFEALCQTSPLMLCLDDVQWADRATGEFLDYLADRIESLPIFLAVAHRPLDTADARHGWIKKSGPLSLPQLDANGTQDLIASMLGTVDVPDDLRAEVFSISGGNPFFVTEAVKALVDKGAILWKKERWIYRGVPHALPQRIEWLVRERVSRLPDRYREILGYASVFGRPVPFDLMAEVWEEKEGDLFELLEMLAHQNLLSIDLQGHYGLFHSLIAESIYNGMPLAKRRKMHRQVGRSLEAYYREKPDEVADEIARHFLRAEAHQKAVPYLLKAGDRALKTYANADAREAYEKALNIVEGDGSGKIWDGRIYSELLCSYVEVLTRTGDRSRAQGYAEKALVFEGLTSGQRGGIYRNLGVTLMSGGKYQEAEKAFLQSAEIFGKQEDRPAEIATLFKLVNLYWVTGNSREASQCVQSTVKLCQATGDDFYLAGGAYLLAHDHLTNSRFFKAEAVFQDALRRYEKLGDERYIHACLMSLQEIYTYRGQLQKAEALLKRAIEAYCNQGIIATASYTLDLGYVYFESGDSQQAETCYLSALKDLIELGNQRKLSLAHVRLSELALAKGDVHKALDYAEKAQEQLGSEPVRQSQVYRVLGRCHAALGQSEKALEMFEKGIAALEEHPGVHLALALLDAGEFHLSLQTYDTAKAQLGNAIEMLRHMGADHFLKKAQAAWENLMEAEKNQKDMVHAETDTVESFPDAADSQAWQSAATLDTDQLFNQAIDRLLEVTGAERGLILTVQGGVPRLQTACSRHLDKPNAADISRSVIQEAIETSDLIAATDAPHDPRFQASQSILNHNIRSIVCMPLKARGGEVIGALYADHRGVRFFAERDIQFFRAFGDFTAVALENALRYHELKEDLEKLVGMRTGLGPLVGSSAAMQTVYDLIVRLSQTDMTVLLQGETGTGKGLAARIIHARSKRSGKPLLEQNCGALPRELLESELFGHSKGAFTGASADRKGLFEAAEDGTVFLDEIGDAPPEVQVRLLHILEEGTVKRVGENHARPVDVRVIAATNRNLEAEIQAGRFREDLYYRLHILPVNIPPLRDRLDDIPLLANHFLNIYSHATRKSVQGFAAEAIRAFSRYQWPGNIRELENEVRRGLLLAQPEIPIGPEHLSDRVAALAGASTGAAIDGPLKAAVEQFEENAIRTALNQSGWNVTHTARKLGLSRVGFQRKMKKYGIQRRTS